MVEILFLEELGLTKCDVQFCESRESRIKIKFALKKKKNMM